MKFLNYLTELSFKMGRDSDYPEGRGFGVHLFSHDEDYQMEGKTHGLMSHAIKHLEQYEPQYVSLVTVNAIKKLKEFKVIMKSSGEMINTFDMIQDKIVNKEKLLPEEESMIPFMEMISKKYEKIVEGFIKNAVDVDQTLDPTKIEKAISTVGIKYTAEQNDGKVKHILNMKEFTLIVLDTNGTVRTMFELDHIKTGQDTMKNKLERAGTKIISNIVREVVYKR